MILIRYIIKEVFRNQLIILILLFLVCICQKLIKIVGVDNPIPVYLIFLHLTLNIPELGKLVIPFSLFLSVFITCYRFHLHNEILAMYSCAINRFFFVKSIFLYSIIVFIISLINVMWLSPYCEQLRYVTLSSINKNIYSIKLVEKKFLLMLSKHTVFFIKKIKNKNLQYIFIVKKNHHINGSNVCVIITANNGDVYNYSNNLKAITLKSGTYYEIHYDQLIFTNIYISDFSRYHTLIDYNMKSPQKGFKIVEHMTISQLICHDSLPEKYIELNWRFTLLVSIIIMPIIALLLVINISNGYFLNFVLAISLYILFFMLHILLRFSITLDYRDSMLYMGGVNVIYFIIALLMNLGKYQYLRWFELACVYFVKR
ncbi:putative permease [Candidatus Blochmanniella vafra str. BVAF]|uniref:Permease n=1 Tax=Blochmanniella vafra (strain BVAF) TaxID=859654 RepID=E8Q6K8_BLOVB|nr:LptF/LptG family permease [Candidatus Blochmannia vafer]ADV33449.1 putative permease [Candidatus Blochmannia vafer str. BVAF]